MTSRSYPLSLKLKLGVSSGRNKTKRPNSFERTRQKKEANDRIIQLRIQLKIQIKEVFKVECGLELYSNEIGCNIIRKEAVF